MVGPMATRALEHGGIVTAETGFVLQEHPPTMLGPDIAWVRPGRARSARPRDSSAARPRERTVEVFRSRDRSRVLAASELLDGGDLLPGFGVPVAEIFPSERCRHAGGTGWTPPSPLR